MDIRYRPCDRTKSIQQPFNIGMSWPPTDHGSRTVRSLACSLVEVGY